MASQYVELIGKKTVGTLLLCMGLCVSAVSVAQEVNLLDQPAIQSVMAARSVMLSVARAGTRLVAVGERGFIIISDDNGVNWKQVGSPVSLTLVKVRFVNDLDGWAVGHAGVVLHSADGGLSWVRQLDGVKGAQLELEDARQQAALADHDLKAQERLAQAQQLVDDGPDKPLLDVLFFNNKDGVVVGAYGLAFATRDGGTTWESIRGRIDNPSGLHLYSVQQLGNDIFLAGEQGILVRSTDSGAHYETLTSPYEGTAFGLQSTANNSLLLFGLRGNAFLSSDRGDSWQKLDTLQSTTLTSGLRLADGSLLLGDESGRLVRYTEGASQVVPLPLAQASYISDMVEAANGGLVISSTRGMLSSAELVKGPENAQ